MIYIDTPKRIKNSLWSHMVADSLLELHRFARIIGLKREWFQGKRYPHYDLKGARIIQKVILTNAKVVSTRKILFIAKNQTSVGALHEG